MNYSVVRSTLVSRVRFISAWKSSAYQASRRDEDAVIRAVENRKKKREREKEREKRIKRARERERERNLYARCTRGRCFHIEKFFIGRTKEITKLEANVL